MTDALKAAVREAMRYCGLDLGEYVQEKLSAALARRGVVVVGVEQKEAGNDGFWALDEDGSIWALDMRKDMPWLKLPPLPQPGDER